MLTIDQLIEEDVQIGTDIEQAIYILSDGTLMDGGFDYGSRCVEHREMELFTETDRYDDSFWEDVILGLQVVMLIPESKLILLMPEQEVTVEQQEKIDEAVSRGYEIEDFK